MTETIGTIHWQPQFEEQKICTRCVMDTSDPDITFDKEGVCNHCRSFEQKIKANIRTKAELEPILNKIKKQGKDKPFDCLMGISGGLDSSYLLAKLVLDYKLRPLVLHLDNGYDTTEALNNMTELTQKLGLTLYLIGSGRQEREEFKDLQIAFLRSSTPDIEIPTDHALKATLYEFALKNGIKYIISGYNVVTEAIMPVAWSHGHADWKYIKSVYQQFGSKGHLEYFPHFSFWKLLWFKYIKRIQFIDPLNYQHYNKSIATEYLTKLLKWNNYTIKHGESIYTRFLQCHILPRKFHYDKRKAHYSTLINSGVLDRDQALMLLSQDPYPSKGMFQRDYDFVLEKLGITSIEFEELMELPPKTIFDYSCYQSTWWYRLVRWIYRKVRWSAKDLRILKG